MWRNESRPFWEEKGKKNEILNFSIFLAWEIWWSPRIDESRIRGSPISRCEYASAASTGKRLNGTGHYHKPQHG